MTREELMREAREKFAQAQLPMAALEARVIGQYIWRCDLTELVVSHDQRVSPEERARYLHLVERRLSGVTISRLTQGREFFGMPFKLNAATLDPRPDSEALVLASLECAAQSAGRVLDLGTGSGALLISFLVNRPSWSGLGVDISPSAVRMARVNAGRLGVSSRATFRVSNWFAHVRGSFDLIMSNPPYIRKAELGALPPDVRNNDPLRALDGGEDGLQAYRTIIAQAEIFLAASGWLCLEIGADQAASVSDMLKCDDWQICDVRTDLAGRDRVIIANKPNK